MVKYVRGSYYVVLLAAAILLVLSAGPTRYSDIYYF